MRLILYIVRRLLILIPTLLGVTIITFTLSHAFGPNLAIAVYCTPKLGACDINNPFLQPIVQQFHLRDPIPVQYVFYMQGLLTGDWGFTTSAIKGGMPVTQAISIFFPRPWNSRYGHSIRHARGHSDWDGLRVAEGQIARSCHSDFCLDWVFDPLLLARPPPPNPGDFAGPRVGDHRRIQPKLH